MEFKFEMTVDDVKTSVVKNDHCPLVGDFTFDGVDVGVKMTFTAAFSKVFSDMFGDVGNTVTFAVIENDQKSLVSYGADEVGDDISLVE